MAFGVCDSDDEVDAMNREMFIKVQKGIQENPQHVEILIHLLSVSRHLERIADLTTNIAEEVIYMINGDIVRHRIEEYELLMNQEEEK
jgi:phosphate transport system protein